MAEPGYFPRGESVLRRVHEERIVGLLYGQRALLMQAMDPVAFDGLLAGTTGRDAPFGRLVRTAKVMERVYFGTREEADRATGGVRAMHARVPAATVQGHLLWILACLADSALKIHERFLGRLGAADRERFWQEYLLLGELFGVESGSAPSSYAEFRSYVRERLASADLDVGPEALELATTVAFRLPLPLTRQAALPLFNHAIVGTLPRRARELYGLPWGALDEVRLTAAATAVRAGAIVLPRALWTGSCARDYDVVAAGERRRLGAAA